MSRFVALYRLPEDEREAEVFGRRYRSSHLPLVVRTPGLCRVEVSRVARNLLGDSAFMLMAVMTFTDREAMRAGMRSEEWARAGANLADLGGTELATMFTLDDPEVEELK